MVQRLMRMIELGDADALRELVPALRRRGELHRLFDLYERLSPSDDELQRACFDALLELARADAITDDLLDAITTRWAPSLLDDAHPERLVLLLAIARSDADWRRIAELAAPEAALTTSIRGALDAHRMPSEELFELSPLGVLFTTARWYREHPRDATVDQRRYRRRTWLRMLARFQDHPAAPWIALPALDASRDVRRELDRAYANVFQERATGPVLHRAVLRPDDAQIDRLWEWLARRPPSRATPFFIERLGHRSKVVRDTALQALLRLGADCLPQLWARLESPDSRTRAHAALALEHIPDPRSIPAIERALEAKPRKRARIRLQLALSAARDEAQPDRPPAEIDAALAQRPPQRIPDTRWLQELPDLSWSDGAPVSEPAREHLIGALANAAPLTGAGLDAVVSALDPDSRALLAERFRRAFRDDTLSTAKRRGVFYGLGVLADEDELDRLGSRLFDLHHQLGPAWSAHGVRILARRPLPVSLFWLERWAVFGRQSLQKNALDALDTLAWEAGLERDALFDQRPFHAGFDPRGHLTLDWGLEHTLRVRLDLAVAPRYTLDAAPEDILDAPPPAKAGDGPAVARSRRRLRAREDRLDQARVALAMRLQRAMRAGRGWTLPAFHTLTAHPAQRGVCASLVLRARLPFTTLLFSLDPATGRPHDIDGRDLRAHLEDASRVDIPHPLELSPELRDAWRLRLSDRDAAFPQLDRPVFTPEDAPSTTTSAAFTELPFVQIWMLQNGYRPRPGYGFAHRYSDGGAAILHITTQDYIVLCSFDAISAERDGRPVPLDRLPPVSYSEALLDLHNLNAYFYQNEVSG